MDHINDRADMSIFDGTEFEGLTYMQVRKRLTKSQAAKFKQLGKRSRKVARTKLANIQHARSYKPTIVGGMTQ